jgi:hypothetical protein
MATKKITLNELRSLVKQIIKEETMLNEGLKLRNNTATKKITLNELRTLVKQVVKEYDLAWDNIDPQGYDYVDKIAASFIDLTKKYGIVGLPYDDYYFNGDIIFRLGLTDDSKRTWYSWIKNPKNEYFKSPQRLLNDYIIDGESVSIYYESFKIAKEFMDWMIDESKIKDEKIKGYYDKLNTSKSKIGEKQNNQSIGPLVEKIINYFKGKERSFSQLNGRSIIDNILRKKVDFTSIHFSLEDLIKTMEDLESSLMKDSDNATKEYLRIVLKPLLLELKKINQKHQKRLSDTYFSPNFELFKLFREEFKKIILPNLPKIEYPEGEINYRDDREWYDKVEESFSNKKLKK